MAEPGYSNAQRPGARLAAIDLGTNSTLLVIAEVGSDGLARPLLERSTITRLGKGIAPGMRLDPERAAHTAKVLGDYAHLIREHQATLVGAVGTEALRAADDGADFIERIAGVTGIELAIISGRQEAELTFSAVANDLLGPGAAVVVDIGGGSTEIITGQGGCITASDSLSMGAVRLTERYIKEDPPSAADLADLRDAVRQTLQQAPQAPSERFMLFGVAGTFTTLVAMVLEVEPYEPRIIHGRWLPLQHIETMINRVIRLPLDQRAQLPGLPPGRADVITGGAIVAVEVIRHYGADGIVVSDRGIRWGIIERALRNEKAHRGERHGQTTYFGR